MRINVVLLVVVVKLNYLRCCVILVLFVVGLTIEICCIGINDHFGP